MPRRRKADQARSSSRFRVSALARAASSLGVAPRRRDATVLGGQDPELQHVLVGQVEARDERLEEGVSPVGLRRDDPLEPLLHVEERAGHDFEQAVLLRLEVVVERRRADVDLGRDVGPLRLLVPVPAEEVDGDLDDPFLLRSWP